MFKLPDSLSRPAAKWRVIMKPLLALPVLFVLDFYVVPPSLSRRLEDFDKEGGIELTVAQGREELILEGLSIPEGSRGLFYETAGKTDLEVQLQQARLVKGSDSAELFRLLHQDQDPPAGFQQILYYSLPSSSKGAAPCPTSFFLTPADLPLVNLRLSQPEKPSADAFRKVRLQVAGKGAKASFSAGVGLGATRPGLSCEKRLMIGEVPWDFYPPLGQEMEVAAGSNIDIQIERLPNAKSNPDKVLWDLFDQVNVRAVKILGGPQSTVVESSSGEPSIVVESIQLTPDQIRLKIRGEGVITGTQAPSLLEVFKRQSALSGTVMALLLITNGFVLLLLVVSARAAWGVESTAPVRIFVSYSRDDLNHKGEILNFMSGLKDDKIEFWEDLSMAAGIDWEKRIKEEISLSDIVLFLVSQSFLDSRNCKREVSFARSKRKILVPIILSPCEWRRYKWLRKLNHRPNKKNETIEQHYLDPGRRKELFLEIREDLRQYAEKIRAKREPLLRRIWRRMKPIWGKEASHPVNAGARTEVEGSAKPPE